MKKFFLLPACEGWIFPMALFGHLHGVYLFFLFLFIKEEWCRPMDTDNLCTLSSLDDKSLVETLAKRYSLSQIYTNCGLLMISINPYAKIDLYSPAVASLYRKRIKNLQPHIYSVVEQCLGDEAIYGEHTIVVSGESGAGKTECARYMLEYLGIPVMNHIDSILESLGNCKTVHNDNSSRFGKLIRMNKKIKIDIFLLEKSRVTGYAAGERNFHVFYYILASRNESLSNDYINFDANKGVLGLGKERDVPVSMFRDESTCQSDFDYSFPSMSSLLRSYNTLKAAFKTIGIDFSVVETILLGILYLGSIEVENNEVIRNGYFEKAAALLQLSEDELESYLLRRVLRINNEEIVRPYTQNESIVLRNSLARQIYMNVFSYALDGVNRYLSNVKTCVKKLNILDIFGFENFRRNGLDQFCINWCNEKIHDLYVREIFQHQKDVLISEGVCDSSVISSMACRCNIRNSSIDLIEKKVGIADLISEESFINGNAENLGLKIKNGMKLEVKPGNILVFRHFNYNVEYDLADFVSKNKERYGASDFFSKHSIRFDKFNDPKVASSSLESPPSPESSQVSNSEYNVSSTVEDVAPFQPTIASFLQTSADSNNLVGYFKRNLEDLFGIIRKTRVKYIKCIKPNSKKLPFVIENELVHSQLKSGGVLESIELSKVLFPYMLEIEDFRQRYPFSDLTEPYLTKGKTTIFFNNEGLRDLERRRGQMVARYDKNIVTLCQGILSNIKSRENAKHLVPRRAEKNALRHAEKDSNTPSRECAEGLTRLERLRRDESACLNVISQIKNDIIFDIEAVNQLNEDHCVTAESDVNESLKRIQEENRMLRKVICDLRKEMELVKKSVAVGNANNEQFSQRYKHSVEKIDREMLETELGKLKQKFKRLMVEEESGEETSIYNIFGNLIQLYIDNCPVYSSTVYQRDEMLSLAHSIFYILFSLGENKVLENFRICLDEIDKRATDFQENASNVAFMLSNFIELRALFKHKIDSMPSDLLVPQLFGHNTSKTPAKTQDFEEVLAELDTSIKNLFEHLCVLQKETIADSLPYAVIDHQPLKSFNKKDSLCTKLFCNTTISTLVEYLEYFYDMFMYFHLPESFVLSSTSYALSFVDCICFNSLLMKKKFLNLRKCYQINYNLAELEKFCFNIGFRDGFLNLVNIREAMKVSSAISRIGMEAKDNPGAPEVLDEIQAAKSVIDSSFLNSAQINSLITLFDNVKLDKLPYSENANKFISEPNLLIPKTSELQPVAKFVKPSYLPSKSLSSILRCVRN